MPYTLPYSPDQLAEVVKKADVPADFLFGVATAGYQAEGGFNGEGDPKNNWYGWEGRNGRDATGKASDFWNQYRADFDRAQWMGLNAFRLGIEWARVQPSSDPSRRHTSPPDFDEAAFDAYAEMIVEARKRGLEPIVTLLHFTTPLWVGNDFWLEGPKVEDLFIPYVNFTIESINNRLVEKFGQPPVKYWVTLNEPFMLASGTYLFRMMPTQATRSSLAAARLAYENILIGHILAYRGIHAISAGKKWERPCVTFNSWAARIYSIDKMAQDLMVARTLGLKKEQVRPYLAECRARFNEQVSRTRQPRDFDGARRAADALLDRFVWNRLNLETMPRVLHSVFEDYHEPRLLDAVSFDYYDPYISNYLGVAGGLQVRRDPWDWTSNPACFYDFLRAYGSPSHGLPLLVLENGFGIRGKTAQGVPRADGARRLDGLRGHLYQLLRAIADGVNVKAFCHWTITDNYEWGSFEPRFGLFAVDYANGAKRLAVDALGDNAPGAYRALVSAIRSGDKDRMLAAFRGEGLESYGG